MTPSRQRQHLPRTLFLALAALVAVFLMTAYVGLLNDAVARGATWRDDPRAPAGAPGANVVKPGAHVT